MEIECKDFQQDRFTQRFNEGDESLLKYYQDLSYDKESIDSVLGRPVHKHTEELAGIIQSEMSPYGLSRSQEDNIERLKKGQRVVIGGQQAGLFMSPAYIIHKIVTLLVLVAEIKEDHGYEAVPVFWIAGEDHDFEEVNHTHIYDSDHRRKRKISYKPNLTVPMSLGFYKYDKTEMKRVLDRITEGCGDSDFLNGKKDEVGRMIEENDYWTELFHALVHDTFKDEGLLIFNAHSKRARQLEIPMFERMIRSRGEIDAAFREGQAAFDSEADIGRMIETDTNVHLFTGSEYTRTLLTYEDGRFISDEAPADEGELIGRLGETPETFSNNVVTRPLMQEMLFNTLIFAGGGAEVKYWGELHKVFETLDVPMPIVLKRMEIIHEDMRIEKLKDEHGLAFSAEMSDDIERIKEALIESHTDMSFLNEVEEIGERLARDYAGLEEKEERGQYRQLLESNMKMHRKQLDYLKRRYQLTVRRSLRRQLNDLDEVSEKLMPGGVLQERVYHPWVFQGQPPTFPTLSYTTQLTVIKTL
ncbi:MAG TPA: bacillithiol biosynthesis cysteine-adding enzyme BshC [Candidatus Salinicoccus stercoripullorum]|uniref:Bacillithiol biosynthesis cysteine-adding enzyme BshC n=1 Tax=Candidatus Salinicoccus stercoripullorum TaxID=2838756 RepID=A0A9D1QGI1_9STAP|nr:bacillithiol biosynthesis cysteine-adding enzyme BshC [Candidatus Salinicoccus stercoripullorum]